MGQRRRLGLFTVRNCGLVSCAALLVLAFLAVSSLVDDGVEVVIGGAEEDARAYDVVAAEPAQGESRLQWLIHKFGSDVDRLLSVLGEAREGRELPACVVQRVMRVRAMLEGKSCEEAEAVLKENEGVGLGGLEEGHEELSAEEREVLKQVLRKENLSEEEKAAIGELESVNFALLEELLAEVAAEKRSGFQADEDAVDEDIDEEDQVALGGSIERNYIRSDRQRAPTSPIMGEGLPVYEHQWELPVHENEAIFIGVVNYRDPQCEANVFDAFLHAKKPERVFVGIAQQWDPEKDSDCLEGYLARCKGTNTCRPKQVRIVRMPASEARGVMYARFLASTLWSGEKFYLQVDAHSGWSPSWDEIAINQWEKLHDERAILTHHPPDMALYPDNMDGKSISVCKYAWDVNKLPRFSSNMVFNKHQGITKPYPAIFVGAGTVFGRSEWIIDCPFDRHLEFLFSGEELLLSVCLYTKGWNLYHPSDMFAWHWYKRDLTNRHNPFNAARRDRAVLRLKYVMQVVEKKRVPKVMLKNIKPFLMGDKRPVVDYWKLAALDWEKKKVIEPFCKVKQTRESHTPLKGLPPLDSYSFDTLPLVPEEYKSLES